MRWLTVCLAVLLGSAAHAADSAAAAPAATLLLPYFEIDATPNFPDGAKPAEQNTYVTFGSNSASATLTRVTLWTDYGVPSLWFAVYLSGWDMERLDLRALFDGVLPRTGPNASHSGAYSLANTTFPNCGGGDFGERLPAQMIEALRLAHLGQASSLFGGQCGAYDHGDGRLRGYLTIDVVSECNLAPPSDPSYIDALAKGTFDSSQSRPESNVLWGKWHQVDLPDNTSSGGNLVHIQSGDQDYPDGATFYRRLGTSGADRREALGSLWGQRYATAGFFTGNPALMVWREPRAQPSPVACGGGLPAYLPGSARQVLAFDDDGNSAVMNPGGRGLSLVSQRVSIGGANLPVPFSFGWLYLNLNYGPNVPGDLAQSYVTGFTSALGRINVSTDAVMLGHFGVNAIITVTPP